MAFLLELSVLIDLISPRKYDDDSDDGFDVLLKTVLALGEPASSIYLNNSASVVPASVAAVSLADIGCVNVTVLDGTKEARAQLLSPDDLDRVVGYFTEIEEEKSLSLSQRTQHQRNENSKAVLEETIDSSSERVVGPSVVVVGMVYTMQVSW